MFPRSAEYQTPDVNIKKVADETNTASTSEGWRRRSARTVHVKNPLWCRHFISCLLIPDASTHRLFSKCVLYHFECLTGLGMIRSRMRWERHAAHMREWEIRAKFWLENLKEKDHLEDLGVDWNRVWGWGLNILVRIGTGGCSFEHGNETSGSIKGGEFLNQDDDGGSKHLWNVSKLLPDYTAQQARRQLSSYSAAVSTWNLIYKAWFEIHAKWA
jgi:hypothetical protein